MTNDDFIKKINAINKDLDAEFFDSKIRVTHPITSVGRLFEYSVQEQDKVFELIKNYSETIFTKNQAIYYIDYFEIIVGLPNTFWIDALGDDYSFEIKRSDEIKDNLIYEITRTSETIDSFLSNNISDFEPSGMVSLKIYNINKKLNIKTSDPQFLDTALKIAKTVIFNISQKSSLALELINVEEYEESPYYDTIEAAKSISKTIIEDRYDKDLLNYFYRALQMQDSEFKYLAFYQVIECIFDEVYLHETVQDVVRIIEASTFSTTNKADIKGLIDVVNRYNKEQNDRNKTKLVLDKYFKGDIHHEAFVLANKETIRILKDELKKIKEEKEIDDIQKLSNIIYDFRCECTHSNRAYPISREFEKSKEELVNYINLIRQISEKIILNYKQID